MANVFKDSQLWANVNIFKLRLMQTTLVEPIQANVKQNKAY